MRLVGIDNIERRLYSSSYLRMVCFAGIGFHLGNIGYSIILPLGTGDTWNGVGVLWGTARWTTVIDRLEADKFYGMGSGETLAHRFFHSGTNEPFWVTRLSAEIAPESETIGQ